MPIKAAISSTYIVQGLNPHEITMLAEISELTTFDGGSTLMRQHEMSSDLMIVIEGGARILTTHGEEIAVLGPGSLVGEIAMLDNEPRSATVTCAGKSKLVVIPGAKLKALFLQTPHIELVMLRNLTKALCKHVRMANIQLDDLRRTN